MSHMSADFVPVLGDCIRMTRDVLYSTTAQPFIMAGSGTLGWDQVAANLVEPGEYVLFLNTGYFGEGFVDCLRVYGAHVDELQAKFGGAVPLSDIEQALASKKYKLIACTHVDTSTAVLCNVKAVAEIVKKTAPDTLIAVDGVCSVASEEIRMDAWGIDVVVTASQKGLGTPPGLSIVVASQRAIQVFENRVTPVAAYYASWKKWLPVMRAYEKGSAAYFATPPVNLVYAYRASLDRITKSSPTLEERFTLHREASKRIKDAVAELGLKQLPVDSNSSANGMTAIYFPDGFTASDIIPRMAQRDVVVAGGVHKDYKDKYFRIGHMGISVVDKERGDVEKVITALKESFAEARASKIV
ncbi:PLP-dependent transferase [Sparassis latifolia]